MQEVCVWLSHWYRITCEMKANKDYFLHTPDKLATVHLYSIPSTLLLTHREKKVCLHIIPYQHKKIIILFYVSSFPTCNISNVLYILCNIFSPSYIISNKQCIKYYVIAIELAYWHLLVHTVLNYCCYKESEH